MPTMKDIAKRAGVSYGTVSNVLNKRGNVSSAKIKIVEKAAEELGYYINEKASDLRSNRKEDIAMIVPTLDDFKLRKLYDLVRKKITPDGFKLNLYITDFNPILEEEYAKIASRTNRYIIIDTCISKPDDLYQKNTFNDIVLIFLNTAIDLARENIYKINFNTQQLNDDIKHYIATKNYQNALLFADYNVIDKNAINIENIDVTFCSQPFNLSTAIEILKNKSYDIIIVSSTEKYQAIISAQKVLKQARNADTIIVTSDDMAFENAIHHYHIDLNQCVDQIEAIINERTDKHHFILPYNGFLNRLNTHKPTEQINLLMIESPATSALIHIVPYMEKLIGFKVNIDVVKYDAYDMLLNKQTLEQYDLIRVDMAYLPEIAESTFKPLDYNFANLSKRMIDNITEYTEHNGTQYTLPFDIGCQILMYRSDVLNNQRIQREYYEETKYTSVVPKDYHAYNTLEDFIHHHYGDIFKGSTVCTGSSITCGNEFIIRVPHNDILDEHGKLNLKKESIKRALNSYLKSVEYSESTPTNRFWDDVIKAYSEGNTVMSIVYSNYIHLLKSYNKELLYKTNFDLTPTKKSLIGGGVIGLSKNTKKDDLCYEFLQVLYSDQISKLLTHLGGTMPSKAIYNDIHLTSMYPWLKLIPTILKGNSRKHYKADGSIHKTIEFEKQIGREVKDYIVNELSNK